MFFLFHFLFTIIVNLTHNCSILITIIIINMYNIYMLQFYLNIYIYLFVFWDRNCGFPIQRRNKMWKKSSKLFQTLIINTSSACQIIFFSPEAREAKFNKNPTCNKKHYLQYGVMWHMYSISLSISI